ncbi:MAG: hypothetical protein HQ497_12850 [SAR86 cluster bacterium]|uniref:Uncharacterized protein n=1 Tax=SAR86 cluster bacterium TaxID=2030880 RepID=A0A973AA78_9GAMM|nr:hypothetical protein [SAR86 cluster bacterium]
MSLRLGQFAVRDKQAFTAPPRGGHDSAADRRWAAEKDWKGEGGRLEKQV